MGQFPHFCIPIIPIMILCVFFIKLIVQIPFVQLLNPFIASIHSILLTLFYYCVPTFTERTLDNGKVQENVLDALKRKFGAA